MNSPFQKQAVTFGQIPRLTPGEVHIWRVEPEEDFWQNAADDLWKTLLDEIERQRVAAYRRESAARHFRAARTILRLLLGEYLGCDPAAVSIRRDSLGKPFTETDPTIHFSLSHSQRTMLVAVSRDEGSGGELGVDVERINADRAFLKLAKRHFAPREFEVVNGIEDRQDAARCFYQFWARKESWGKAVGTGLLFPIRDWDTSGVSPQDEVTPPPVAKEGRQTPVHIYDIPAGSANAAAVATAFRPTSITLLRLAD